MTMTTTEEKRVEGKKGRASGKRWELLVRKDLEKQGWFVVKWANQIDFEKDCLIPAKNKFNPFLGRVMSEGSGFPDFLCYKRLATGGHAYEVAGVESKLGKYLSAEEKKKCQWLLDHHVFTIILIAYKKKRGEISYDVYCKE